MSDWPPRDPSADHDAGDTTASLRAEVQRLTALLDQAPRSYDRAAEQLALAVDLADIAIWRNDLGERRTLLSAKAREMLGLPAQQLELSHEELLAALHPDDIGVLIGAVEQAKRSGKPADALLRYRHPDGSLRHVLTRRVLERSAFGEPLAMVGVGIDLTEQISVERRHAQAMRQFELAAIAAGIGHWTVPRTFGPMRWSEQVCRLHQLPARSAAPGPRDWLRRHIAHDERAPLKRRFIAWLRSDAPELVLDLRVLRSDGAVRQVRCHARADRGGGSCELYGVLIDLTEQRAAEAALRENKARSQFLSRMSHELRTPLNAVLGFTQLLLADNDRTAVAERQRRLRHIESAGQHLLSLIDDVLDLSSLEGGELPIVARPVPLHALLTDTLPLLEALAQRHRVTLHTDTLAGVPMADEKRLRQVLLNLLSNAIKYNREGGEVHVGAEDDGGTVRLHITDTGVGMSAEQLDHAFEPFNRLGRESAGIEGTGIGLPIVKALVDNMGGSVQLHSRVGVGTRVEVRLPAAPAGTAPTPDATRTTPAPLTAGRPARLLYIEDNPVNALILQELVALRANTTLHIATTGLGGVQQALALDPDLVLVDMQLPDIDGFEVLRRLRALPQTARTVCVVLSANAMPDVIQRALRAGFAAYLTKPLDFARYRSALDELLGG